MATSYASTGTIRLSTGRVGRARWDRRPARRSRGRGETGISTLIVCLLLALVLGCGLVYTGMVPAFSGLVPGFPQSSGPPSEVTAVRYVEGRTGQILFVPIFGEICRQVIFNNDTGRWSRESRVRCEDVLLGDLTPESRTAASGERLTVIREAFARK